MISKGTDYDGDAQYLYHDTEMSLPVGWLYLRPSGELLIWVEPERRGEGVGKALLEALLNDQKIDITQQRFTPAGSSLTTAMIDAFLHSKFADYYTCDEIGKHLPHCSCP